MQHQGNISLRIFTLLMSTGSMPSGSLPTYGRFYSGHTYVATCTKLLASQHYVATKVVRNYL